jgi:hypothetical protein
LAFRDAGNLPDAEGRTLRLVLTIDDAAELSALDEKRLFYEPDHHEAPRWRTSGSKPVHVVPLRDPDVVGVDEAWWEDADMSRVVEEWEETGAVGGLIIPADLRGLLFKTVLALQKAGVEVTPASVADSLSRWLDPAQAADIRARLLKEAD